MITIKCILCLSYQFCKLYYQNCTTRIVPEWNIRAIRATPTMLLQVRFSCSSLASTLGSSLPQLPRVRLQYLHPHVHDR